MSKRPKINHPPILMSGSERAALLDELERMPPEMKTATLDQRQQFRRTKQIMLMLREEFKTYFSGQKSYSSTLDNPKDKDFLRWQRNRWLWFYQLCFDYFDLLETKAAEFGFEIPATPGEYLIACLDEYSISLYWSGTSNFSPSKAYKAYQQSNKLRPAFEKSPDERNKSEQLRIDQFLEKFSDCWTPRRLVLLRSLAEAVFATHAKKDRSLKKIWQMYQSSCDEVAADSARHVHPQRGLFGYRWEGGTRIQM